jgi:hypothetical protein
VERAQREELPVESSGRARVASRVHLREEKVVEEKPRKRAVRAARVRLCEIDLGLEWVGWLPETNLFLYINDI